MSIVSWRLICIWPTIPCPGKFGDAKDFDEACCDQMLEKTHGNFRLHWVTGITTHITTWHTHTTVIGEAILRKTPAIFQHLFVTRIPFQQTFQQEQRNLRDDLRQRWTKNPRALRMKTLSVSGALEPLSLFFVAGGARVPWSNVNNGFKQFKHDRAGRSFYLFMISFRNCYLEIFEN